MYEEVNNAFERALVFMHKVGTALVGSLLISCDRTGHTSHVSPCVSLSLCFNPLLSFFSLSLFLSRILTCKFFPLYSSLTFFTVFLSRQMPRIWMDYCQFLVDQCKITRTRRTFDRALRSLPLTQHVRIWPLYIKFVRKHNIPETTVRIYRRYVKVRSTCHMLFRLYIC